MQQVAEDLFLVELVRVNSAENTGNKAIASIKSDDFYGFAAITVSPEVVSPITKSWAVSISSTNFMSAMIPDVVQSNCGTEFSIYLTHLAIENAFILWKMAKPSAIHAKLTVTLITRFKTLG